MKTFSFAEKKTSAKRKSFCRRAGCDNCIHSVTFYPKKQSECPFNDLEENA